MFPQHALRMTSCHAGSLQCWFETQLWEPDYSVVALRNGAQTSLQNLMIAPKRGRSDPAQQASKCMHVNNHGKALVKDDLKLTNALVVVLLKTSLQTTPG